MEKCEVCGNEADSVRKSGYYQGPVVKGESNYKRICSECQRYSNMYRAYGITRWQYSLWYGNQGGRCAVCNEPKTVLYPDKKKDKPVRGLLCRQCKDLVRCMEVDMGNTRRALVYLGQGEL